MSLTHTINSVGKKGRVDVVVMTNLPAVPARLGEALLEKGLDWLEISFDKLHKTVKGLQDIGVVVIDTDRMESEHIKRLHAVLGLLSERKIPTLFLNNRLNLNLKSFPFARVIDTKSGENAGEEIAEAVSMQRTRVDCRAEEALEPGGDLAEDTAEQLKMAGEVQRNFLPRTLPNTEQVRWACMYEPADWVSGDIYDITRLDEQHMGFYIADAVGHSMPAALLTMFIKQAIIMRQTFGSSYRIFGPLDVIRELNTRMCSQNLGQLFATCCYCLLNTRTLQLTWCRGGHPYPVLISKDGTIRTLESRGSLIGVFEEAEFVQETIQLEPGDKVILYSDGLDKVVGSCGEDQEFIFSDTFRSLARYRIEHLISEFSMLSRHIQFSPEEIDDRTAVGMEIL